MGAPLAAADGAHEPLLARHPSARSGTPMVLRNRAATVATAIARLLTMVEAQLVARTTIAADRHEADRAEGARRIIGRPEPLPSWGLRAARPRASPRAARA
jgi:hypothetical protein